MTKDIIEVPTDESDIIDYIPQEWLTGKIPIFILHNEDTHTAWISKTPVQVDADGNAFPLNPEVTA